MSGDVLIPEPGPAFRASRTGGLPFSRLMRAEWRKQIDTRASRWVLIAIALVTAAVLVTMASVDGGDRSFDDLLAGTTMPMGILLPVVGILAATQEWSQRTGLVTFVLEPRRPRVGVAKLGASLTIGVIFVAASFALAALTHLALVTFRDVEAQWAIRWPFVAGMALVVLLSMVQGVAFGLVLQNTPAAIVLFFALPSIFAFGVMIPWLETAMPWIDLGTAAQPLRTGTVTGREWAQLASSTTIWVVAPLVGGLVRLSRSEIRSA